MKFVSCCITIVYKSFNTRTKKFSVIVAMLLSTSAFCVLFILTLSCSAGVLDPDNLSHPGHLSKVILVRDGDEDETKYQQVLERTGDSHNYLGRKPLLESGGSETELVVSYHGRRRHKDVISKDNSAPAIEDNLDPRATEIKDVSIHADLLFHDDHSPQKFDGHDKSQKLHKRKRTKIGDTLEMPVRRLPQAIIIGVKKGGTRALLEFIRMHPDVRALGPEPHFFDRNYDKGLDWYRRQMPPTYEEQLTIEKTPGYFVTKGVPGRIFNMSKNVKFIVVVRDPVTRAVSDYTQALAKRTNISSFEEMALEDNSTGLVDTSWGAIRIGVYAKHLERWLEYFSLSQMHFVSGEKLIKDPAGEMAGVQDFLGLRQVISNKNFLFNTTKGFPCLIRPKRGPKKPHCLSETKGRKHPKIDLRVLQRLRDFFRPFNQKFYQMVGQDFGWS